MISARIIADSLAPCDKRLTTFVLTYPWFIHWDLLTHRQLSRNTMSTRAMPVWKVIRQVLREPAKPRYWSKNGKGMQAHGELRPSAQFFANMLWLLACYFTVGVVWLLNKLGLHKQDANKLLTPFMHNTAIVSGTEWENFFALRAHPDAHPTFQALADAMLEEYLASEPRLLREGEWHMPFTDKLMRNDLTIAERLKVATARCARVSYLSFEGDIDKKKDFKLHDDLLANGHMSPFEHSARAEAEPVRSGNFVGFTQYRKQFQNEVRRLSRADLERLLEERKRAA